MFGIVNRFSSVYLANPEGELKKMDVGTGKVTKIATGLPKDPYSGLSGSLKQIADWLKGMNQRNALGSSDNGESTSQQVNGEDAIEDDDQGGH